MPRPDGTDWSVQLNGSNVAIPVDMQFHNLADSQALPVRGKLMEDVRVATSFVVAAGATTTVYTATDLAAYDEIALDVFETSYASHTFAILLHFLHTDGTRAVTSTLTGGTLTKSVSSTFVAGVERIKVLRPRVQIQITNSDAAAKTYHVNLYKFPR